MTRDGRHGRGRHPSPDGRRWPIDRLRQVGASLRQMTVAPGPLAGRDDDARFDAPLASHHEAGRVRGRHMGRGRRDPRELRPPARGADADVVPLPGRNRVVIVSASSPVLPLAEGWFDVFDAITGTLRLL